MYKGRVWRERMVRGVTDPKPAIDPFVVDSEVRVRLHKSFCDVKVQKKWSIFGSLIFFNFKYVKGKVLKSESNFLVVTFLDILKGLFG